MQPAAILLQRKYNMKRHHLLSIIILTCLCAAGLSSAVFADSSWVWISETRPYDVLPWAAVATLLVETAMLWLLCKLNHPFKVFCVVALGNLLSFALPYVLYYVNRIPWYTFFEMLEHGPYYIVGFVFLAMTLLVEMPVVYELLKNDCADVPKTRLLYTVIAANAITTAMVAIIERTFCRGHW